MTKWIKRKDFEKTFLPLTSKGNQIWVKSILTFLTLIRQLRETGVKWLMQS